ncbi:HK97 gp10 family phage protein [Holdemanella porci]|jgi:HK97 gp10 family phage protein|uniref:HK97 gp10 family phage protein n=1 Tax=Holdemanella porci TaxID=2652276 RepID=UPI0030758196|nr:HK97 gp10 family phage protein [Lachnospiraceae bacterium]
MASDRVKIDGMAAAIMKGLEEYAEVATSDLKASVRKAGSNVRKDIQANAPKKTGAYSKSWSVKTTKETSNTLELTVYSPKKYQLAHLLEYGHAKRGGGRTKAQPHIAPAEEAAISQLERDIKRSLGG